MRDLLIITPSRSRPASVKRLTEAVAATCTAHTDLVFAFDDGDPDLEASVAAMGQGPMCFTGPRRPMAAWTNSIASTMTAEYRALASLGDDHVPRTHGWDSVLLAAIGEMGGTGIAYGDDLLARDLPTAAVVTSDIVSALGWMCLPGLAHYCPDNVWFDLGEGAGCLAHRPGVVIEHLHPAGGKAGGDQTYSDAGGFSLDHPDWHAYQDWRANQMGTDVATVKALMA